MNPERGGDQPAHTTSHLVFWPPNPRSCSFKPEPLPSIFFPPPGTQPWRWHLRMCAMRESAIGFQRPQGSLRPDNATTGIVVFFAPLGVWIAEGGVWFNLSVRLCALLRCHISEVLRETRAPAIWFISRLPPPPRAVGPARVGGGVGGVRRASLWADPGAQGAEWEGQLDTPAKCNTYAPSDGFQ